MNTAKQLSQLIQKSIEQSRIHHIVCESPQTTLFLKEILHTNPQNIHTFPCANDAMLSTAMGMCISGAHVLLVLSTDQDLDALYAILHEESYGTEFPLSLTILLPSKAPQVSLFPLVHCTTGTQLLAHVQQALHTQNLNFIGYAPHALLDIPAQEAPSSAITHQEGEAITLFTTGIHIEAAQKFTQNHHDIELIELVSLCPLPDSLIAKSVQKTGRVLLLEPPKELLKTILDEAFWHLEAQPEITKDPSMSNLEQLRLQLLEP